MLYFDMDANILQSYMLWVCCICLQTQWFPCDKLLFQLTNLSKFVTLDSLHRIMVGIDFEYCSPLPDKCTKYSGSSKLLSNTLFPAISLSSKILYPHYAFNIQLFNFALSTCCRHIVLLSVQLCLVDMLQTYRAALGLTLHYSCNMVHVTKA